MPAGSTITYTVVANIAPNATGTLVNTATVAVPAGHDRPDIRATTRRPTPTRLTPQVTLQVVKNDGSSTYTPGGTATYTVTVTNTGASDAANVTVTDLLPAGLTLTANVSCTAERHRQLRHAFFGSIGGTSFGTTGATIGGGRGQFAGVHGAGGLRFGHDDRSAAEYRNRHRSGHRRDGFGQRHRHARAAGDPRRRQDRRQRDVYAGRHARPIR